jgi:hypothetical protein
LLRGRQWRWWRRIRSCFSFSYKVISIICESFDVIIFSIVSPSCNFPPLLWVKLRGSFGHFPIKKNITLTSQNLIVRCRYVALAYESKTRSHNNKGSVLAYSCTPILKITWKHISKCQKKCCISGHSMFKHKVWRKRTLSFFHKLQKLPFFPKLRVWT